VLFDGSLSDRIEPKGLASIEGQCQPDRDQAADKSR
jgi:hypothetical protein